MSVGRSVAAHLCAVLVGSFVLTVGVETIYIGAEGFFSGAAKWIGGIIIFLVLAVVSIPIGLGLRWSIGKLPIAPSTSAVLGGLIVSLALLTVLHPSMRPTISVSTHTFSLVLLHVIAGASAGWIWLLVETETREKPVA